MSLGSTVVRACASGMCKSAACEKLKCSTVKVTMLLADFAQVADGKLIVIGGGWSLTGPEPTPFGIAILVHVPWDQANRRHTLRLELVDADGQPVMFPVDGEEEERQIVFLDDVEFEVGRPAGIKPGTPLELPLAVNSGPLALEPGGRYEWRLTIDGEGDEDWRLAFSVRVEEEQELAARARLLRRRSSPRARPAGAREAAVRRAGVVARRVPADGATLAT